MIYEIYEFKNYEFDWSEKEINIMLSAFFYGYIITQVWLIKAHY